MAKATSKKPSDDDKALFVRIDSKLKDLVEKHSAEYKSERVVIEKLLRSFEQLSEDEQKEILDGKRTLGQVGSIEALGNWGGHTFYTRLWPWSLLIHDRMLKKYGPRSKELRLQSLYRKSYSWIMLGRDLRDQAVRWIGRSNLDPAKWLRNFDQAKQAFHRSIACNRKFMKESDVHLVEYNSACSFSRLAQLTVEKALAVNPPCPWAEKLRQELDRPVEIPDSIWVTEIGLQWRSILEKSGKERRKVFRTDVDTEEVDRYAQAAAAELNKLSGRPSTPSFDSMEIPLPSPAFDQHYCNIDPDFLFLRSDTEFRDAFERFAGTEEQKDDWLSQTVEKLLSAIPDETL